MDIINNVSAHLTGHSLEKSTTIMSKIINSNNSLYNITYTNMRSNMSFHLTCDAHAGELRR